MNREIVYMDLFSGTGGFALGLLNAGFKFKKHYFCEVDPYAISNTLHNFKNATHVGAIEKIRTKGIEKPNIITFGSPCQDISVASGGKGLKGKKSRLFFDAIKIIKRLKPDCFVFENVRNILSSNQGKDFEAVLRSIAEIGIYDCQWQLLNSSLVLPQNRERLFLVGHLSEKTTPEVFPIQVDSKTTGKIRKKESLKVTGQVYKSNQSGYVYHTSGKSPAFLTDPSAFFIDNGKEVRNLTPIEAERVQGFPDNWTKFGINDSETVELSDTQRYKLLGNAVSPKTFQLIADKLIKSVLFNNADTPLKGMKSNQVNKFNFVTELFNNLLSGINVTRLNAEKIARKFGIHDKTEIKELTELAIVKAAREIPIKGKTIKERFNWIVDLYNRQPNLSHRSSNSVKLNQYSTSIPLGFLMGAYCGLLSNNHRTKVFEPSAGNGALTILANPTKTWLNEIDPTRFENLQLIFPNVTDLDASNSFPKTYHKRFDALIMNPPFGLLGQKVDYKGFQIKSLDHLMVLQALETMKDKGKAAIIIGGEMRFDSTGRIQKGEGRYFFNYLYHHFNVEDIIQIDSSKLYHKQGTTFPIRMVLIDRRKESPLGAAPTKSGFNLDVVNSFEALYHRISKYIPIMKQRKKLSELEEMAKRLLDNGLGAPYVPASEACVVLDTQVPDSMAYEMHSAVARIKEDVGGDIDNFVRHRLGYNTKAQLCKVLSAEQIDAVAMCIYNIEALGQAVIIGDQTGIGKGRVAAAMIRYGSIHSIRPIFLTEKANLFSDIYRDLKAIGSAGLNPFIVNSKESKTNIKDEHGNIIYTAPEKLDQDRILKSNKLSSEYDFIAATYSQFNSPKKPLKRNFLLSQSSNKLVIMDESHNASGLSNTGQFMREVLELSKGAVFLSATFAKRPDNMPLYAMKTAISEASLPNEDLVDAIIKGGVALQEILASQLVGEGQMIRRERTYEGVRVDYTTLLDKANEHRAIADNITEIIRDIIAFQRNHINSVISLKDEILALEGEQADVREGTQDAGADSMPYFSKVFNIINQMLFSIKADAVADIAIQKLKEDKKPIIAFSSTMGSFIEQMENEYGGSVSTGDTVKADFALVLQKGLDGVMRYTETRFTGKKEFKIIELDELSPEAQQEYHKISRKIQKASTGITISPIDVIVQKLESNGYKVAEVTGRKLKLKLNLSNGTGIVQARKKLNTNDAFREFNDNEVDALLINQSGSTGASAHAIVTSKVRMEEVKTRCMIVLQPELDINQEVQKRGRIHRTGQILKPEYDYINSAIPAEQRLMMMLQKKLKSLDANTSSNQKQSNEILDVPDFLNKYGDMVVQEYLKEAPEINELLGDPLKINGAREVKEGAAHKVSGRVAVLSTEMQTEFYEEIKDRYDNLVEYLKQSGEYDLEVEELNLQAKTLSVSTWKAGKGGITSFGEDSILERCEVNNLRKPFTETELANLVEQSLSSGTAEQITREIIEHHSVFTEKKLNEKIAKISDEFKTKIENVAFDPVVLRAEKKGEPIDLNERIKELQAVESKKISAEKEKHRNTSSYLLNLFKFFSIGSKYHYPVEIFNTSNTTQLAVFLGFQIDQKKKNPYAPSSIKLRFAIASSHKYIALPASNNTLIQAIRGVSFQIRQTSFNDLRKEWNDVVTENTSERTIRYMVTGNILQALDSVEGKLVSYTTFDGETKKGILLHEFFKPSEQTNVTVPILVAQKIIQAMAQGTMVFANGGISVTRLSPTKWRLIVPASKAKGGETYLNEDLLKHIEGGNFNKSSNNMIGDIEESNLINVLRILQRMGVSVSISTNIAESVGLVYEKVKRRAKITPPPEEQKVDLKLLELEAKAAIVKLKLIKLKNAA